MNRRIGIALLLVVVLLLIIFGWRMIFAGTTGLMVGYLAGRLKLLG
jgi:hypothetical protein